jgi:hypothetical protein
MDYRCYNKHGEEGLDETEMRDSYLEKEVPTSVEEEHDHVNEVDILGLTDVDIEFQVHNIEEMIRNVKRHGNDDQYGNGELVKEDDQRLKSHSIMVMHLSTRDCLQS